MQLRLQSFVPFPESRLYGTQWDLLLSRPAQDWAVTSFLSVLAFEPCPKSPPPRRLPPSTGATWGVSFVFLPLQSSRPARPPMVRISFVRWLAHDLEGAPEDSPADNSLPRWATVFPTELPGPALLYRFPLNQVVDVRDDEPAGLGLPFRRPVGAELGQAPSASLAQPPPSLFAASQAGWVRPRPITRCSGVLSGDASA